MLARSKAAPPARPPHDRAHVADVHARTCQALAGLDQVRAVTVAPSGTKLRVCAWLPGGAVTVERDASEPPLQVAAAVVVAVDRALAGLPQP